MPSKVADAEKPAHKKKNSLCNLDKLKGTLTAGAKSDKLNF